MLLTKIDNNLNNRKTIGSIKANLSSVFQKKYIFWFFGIIIFYLTVNILTSQFYITVKYIYMSNYFDTINWTKLILSAFFALIIAVLISINSILTYIKHKQRKDVKKSGAVTCAATIGGLATGICPVCITGLFPLIFSLFGLSFSWIAMPFNGIEVQIIVILILLTNFWYLTK